MRVTGITCAKNEGPFILEWIVYHRLIGFTDIVVFTNDCTDGTDGLLDRLDEMGYIKHLPNPRILNSALRFQKAALEFAVGMREVRNADWFMSFDSDEFVNITVGHGTVTDLVDSYKDPEMICVCQLQHGCAGMETYTPGLSIEQFQMAQRFEADPGTKMRRDLERGLKTLVSGKAPITEINNHKPAVEVEREKDVRWLYGDDQRVPQQIINGKGKSLPYQGAYARATLNHYATRSMESFLVQSHRGNAVKTYEHADIKYGSAITTMPLCTTALRVMLQR